jgi:hypothetical protein
VRRSGRRKRERMEKSWLGRFGGMCSARGALGCGRGAAEAANGGKQDCGGALATVVEQRRKRGGEKKSRRV